nr:MAG TPA: hypothetical protein [Caudoviricetes sp.]DAQ49230.1 MAG TPA: hypothetical protein [Caudoviricetes sp.]
MILLIKSAISFSVSSTITLILIPHFRLILIDTAQAVC